MSRRSVTIIVPVYEEAASLDTLAGEIREVAGANELDVEVVFVDDGSRDTSWSVIQSLAESDPSIGGVRFRRNRGKAAALMAGFAAARGELVVTMDADLQDPPEELPRLIDRLDQGFDMVSGWKRVRHDPWHKVYPSRVFNALIGTLTGVHLHDHVCGLKLYRREVVKELKIYGEMHRFLGVLSADKGFAVTEIPTLHRARTKGVGKYGFTRFAKGFLDLLTVTFLTRYGWRPQHLIGTVGLLSIGLNLLLLWLAVVGDLGRGATLGWAMLLWSGVMLIAIGLVAEMYVANRPVSELYTIVDRAGWCAGARTMPDKTPQHDDAVV